MDAPLERVCATQQATYLIANLLASFPTLSVDVAEFTFICLETTRDSVTGSELGTFVRFERSQQEQCGDN